MKKYLCTLVVSAFVSLNAFGQVEIDNAKNVGIGIATPTQKLDINGQLRVRTIPISAILNEVLVRDGDGVVHYRNLETFSFWTKVGDSLFSDPLCFVGIGTSSPVKPLHVRGALRVEGDHHGHVTILKGPEQGLGGMTMETKDELRLSTFDSTGNVRATTVVVKPSATAGQASFDSFFDIFTDLGECRYRAGRIDTGGLSGTGIRLSELAEISSLTGPGENGGIIKLRADVSRPNGGSALTISNIGSSGLDGVRLVFDADTNSGAIAYHGFDPDPDNNCAVVLSPSTKPNTSNLVVKNIGSSGLDGVRMSFDADTGKTGYYQWELENTLISGIQGPRMVLAPDASLTHDKLVVSNIGSSGLDGVRLSIHKINDQLEQGQFPQLQIDNSGMIGLDPGGDAGGIELRNIGSSGQDGVRMHFDDGTGAHGFFGWEYIPADFPSGGGGGTSLVLAPSSPGVALNRNGQLVVSNIGSSGQDGVSIDTEGELRFGSIDTIFGVASATTVAVKPTDNTRQVSFDSFFDIFVDAGECRYRAGRIDTNGFDGTGILLSDAHQISGVNGGGGAGGSIWLQADITQPDGGSRLKVSNLGSSGCDGVSIDLGEDARIEGRNEIAGGGGGGGRLAFIFDDASTDQRMLVSNIGSSGLDGVGFSDEAGEFWFENLLPGVHNPHGGALRLTPRKLPSATGNDRLTISNIGSSGCDGVSIDVDHAIELRSDNAVPANPRATTVRITPLDTGQTPSATYDSFFDIFVDAGECRYRAVDNSSDTTEGTGMLLHDKHLFTGIKPTVGGAGGSILFHPDVTQQNGGSKLRVSNLGSSGCDGVSISNPRPVQTEILSMDLVSVDPVGILGPRLRMTTSKGSLSVGNTGSAASSGISLMDESLGNTGGHVNFLPNSVCLFPGTQSYFSVLSSSHPRGTATGVRLSLDQNAAAQIQPAMDFNRDGSMDLVVRRAGGNNDRQLHFDNIGSSGQDGVRLSLLDPAPVPIELISLSLQSVSPISVLTTEADQMRWVHSFDDAATDDRIITRRVEDVFLASPTRAFPHVYEYDGFDNEIRESGPPTREYESNQLRTTYEYDGLNRIVREVRSDESIATPPTTTVEHVFPPAAAGPPSIRFIAPQVLVQGDLDVAGQLCAATFCAQVKLFKIDHPLDPYNKNLRHVSVESPDMMNLYNGNIKTDKKGYATVTMPDYFSALNMDFRYQLTVMGEFAQAIVKKKLANNKFIIQSDKPNVEVSWQVTGIRQDTYAKENRVQVEADKEADMIGKLLYEPKLELGMNK